MGIDLDPTAALRRPADLEQLVDAIFRADAEDELDWLEWKSSLDLRAKGGQFAVARAVLGMANRDPSRAAAHVGGLGYVVVGVEPKDVRGVHPVDPARLDDGLSRYLGHEGPQWSAQYVAFANQKVLVVTVEAPRMGDPLFPLCSSYHDQRGEGATDGAVFIRSGTKTRPATAPEVRMLSRRAAAVAGRGSDGPDVSVSAITEGVPVLNESRIRQLLAERADERSDKMIQDGLRRKLEQERSVPQLGRALSNLSSGFRHAPDWDEYATDVMEWAAQAQETGWEQILFGVTEAGVGQVALRVENLSKANLAAVDVVVSLPQEARLAAFDEGGAEEPIPPSEPTPYGSVSSTPFGIGPTIYPSIGNTVVPRASRSGVYVADADGIALTYVIGDLRPDGVITSEPAFVLLLDPDFDEVLTVVWSATSTGIDGVRRGELALPYWRELDPEKAVSLATALGSHDNA